MKYGKYENAAPKESRNGGTKMLALILSLVLLICCVVGTTLAWLADKTDPVENVFTASNITVTLEEPEGVIKDYKFQMIPGHTIPKDPKVTVKAGSEDCYLFVEVTKGTDLEDYITYGMADGWNGLDGYPNVYYRKVSRSDADQPFPVLLNNQVAVRNTVTSTMMGEVASKDVTLSFIAYAIQLFESNGNEFTNAVAAWTALQNQLTTVGQ